MRLRKKRIGGAANFICMISMLMYLVSILNRMVNPPFPQPLSSSVSPSSISGVAKHNQSSVITRLQLEREQVVIEKEEAKRQYEERRLKERSVNSVSSPTVGSSLQISTESSASPGSLPVGQFEVSTMPTRDKLHGQVYFFLLMCDCYVITSCKYWKEYCSWLGKGNLGIQPRMAKATLVKRKSRKICCDRLYNKNLSVPYKQQVNI